MKKRSQAYKLGNFQIPKNMVPVAFLIIVFTVISFLVSFKAILAHNGTEMLLVLPASFGMLLLLSGWKFLRMPLNFGAILVVGIEFVKLVLVPFFFVLANYPRTITYNAMYNDYYGILLQMYEAFWIGYALNRGCKYKQYKLDVANIDKSSSNKKLKNIMIVILILTIIICVLAPEILFNYRSILSASDSEYTNIEQDYIVNMYATSTTKKLFLVIANYWLKPMRLILPAYAIVIAARYVNRVFAKIISFILVLSPFIFVDGTVARSLYFTIVLFLLYNYLFTVNPKNLVRLIAAATLFIIIYWCVRYYAVPRDNSLFEYFAEKLNDYFCGFNIVGGTLNLPGNIKYRNKYFIQDFTRTIPFANTIFGMDGLDTIRVFFNTYNHTTGGQIASTLGMGSYYLSPLLAPVYSYVFTRNTINYAGLANDIKNPYYKLVYYFIALYFGLGVGLNDISVTLANLVQVCLPIFIIINMAYPRTKEWGKR